MSGSSDAAVAALFIGPKAGAPMLAVDEVVAVVEQGLEGDRTFRPAGRRPRKDQAELEVTLIESEAVAAANAGGVALEPIESRRNILTRGVALNPLVGREFRIGDVRLKGVRLCDPCSHLQKLTRPGVLKALAGRGGLRAQILAGASSAWETRSPRSTDS